MLITSIDKLSTKKIGENSYACILNHEDVEGMTIGITKLYPGEEIPLNTHKTTEVFLILSGHAKLYESGINSEMNEGDIVIIPADTEHLVKNIGGEILQMIFIMPPMNTSKDL